MPKVYGLDEQSVKRVANVLRTVENMPSANGGNVVRIPEVNGRKLYPYGSSFAFGIDYSICADGIILRVGKGFTHSQNEKTPISIEAKVFCIAPYSNSEEFYHVFIDLVGKSLRIVRSSTQDEFDDPSYYRKESEFLTPNGVKTVKAEDSSADEDKVDFAVAHLLYSLHIKEGSLITILRANGSSAFRPDTDATAGEDSESRSIEVREVEGEPKCLQIRGFDSDNQVADGLKDLLESDPATGAISAKGNASDYEILVRVKSTDGGIRAVGYMPIGDVTTPTDPTTETPPVECGQSDYPAGGGEGEAPEETEGPYGGEGGELDDGSGDGSGNNSSSEGSNTNEGTTTGGTDGGEDGNGSNGGGSVGDGSTTDDGSGGDTGNDTDYVGKSSDCW